MQTKRAKAAALVAAFIGVTIAACVEAPAPTGADAVALTELAADMNEHSGAHADKQFIGGWLDGEDMELRYTRMYFCEEPPASAAITHCEVGAPAEVTPRGGPIPFIYAIAAAGFQPPPSTLHCPAGRICPNHPTELDLTRVGGMEHGLGGPHSHIITDRRGGWHQTVNIRVSSLAVWNEIAAAKTLARVRELQADPAIGGAGLISQDRPTNVFFFLEVHKP